MPKRPKRTTAQRITGKKRKVLKILVRALKSGSMRGSGRR